MIMIVYFEKVKKLVYDLSINFISTVSTLFVYFFYLFIYLFIYLHQQTLFCFYYDNRNIIT